VCLTHEQTVFFRDVVSHLDARIDELKALLGGIAASVWNPPLWGLVMARGGKQGIARGLNHVRRKYRLRERRTSARRAGRAATPFWIARV